MRDDSLAADKVGPGLRLAGVSISLQGTKLFPPLTLTVRAPYPTTLMGPSGSGKSSLLHWLSGHLPPEFQAEGEVYIGDLKLNDLNPQNRKLGILFQDDLLFPHLTVGENLAFGLPPHFTPARRRVKVNEALLQAGLEGFANRDPGTLSGGQRARIALLRTLISHPKALLLDEPFAKLDRVLRDKFRSEIFQECARRAIPVLQVTHDISDAQQAGGPIVDLLSGIIKPSFDSDMTLL